MDLRAYIRDIPDFPKPGILFKDITPLLAAPDAFRHVIELMTNHARRLKIERLLTVFFARACKGSTAGGSHACQLNT